MTTSSLSPIANDVRRVVTRTAIPSTQVFDENLPSSSCISNSDDKSDNMTDDMMVIVFGRPGAGKTTIANTTAAALAEYMLERSTALITTRRIVALDLDVCVPQWMKENFNKGIYPTLEERLEFAENACHYVVNQQEQQQQQQEYSCSDTVQKADLSSVASRVITPTITLISFSFVNTDLRDVFRTKFPHAIWCLVDTTEEEAQRRIVQREGHFYKGKINLTTSDKDSTTTTMSSGADEDKKAKTGTNKMDAANSDWDFAPVTFDHLILPGNDTVEENAQRVTDTILSNLLSS